MMVVFQTRDGEIWVNPDHVLYVRETQDGMASIYFANGAMITVLHTPDEVKTAIEAAWKV